jgi:hypothetical protein
MNNGDKKVFVIQKTDYPYEIKQITSSREAADRISDLSYDGVFADEWELSDEIPEYETMFEAAVTVWPDGSESGATQSLVTLLPWESAGGPGCSEGSHEHRPPLPPFPEPLGVRGDPADYIKFRGGETHMVGRRLIARAEGSFDEAKAALAEYKERFVRWRAEGKELAERHRAEKREIRERREKGGDASNE